MTHVKLKNLISLLSMTMISVVAHANVSVTTLSEGDTLWMQPDDYTQSATYSIEMAGSDAWLDSGQYHVTNAMPACLIVLSDQLSKPQLEKLVNDLSVTTNFNKELSIESYKGTLTYVDKSPYNSAFGNTIYNIKTKDNLTFGQLIQSVGGKQGDSVAIIFDRGCAELATRPFLPENLHDIKNTDLKSISRQVRSIYE